MPLIIPSNTISAGGYEVDNSLRFDDGSSDYLSKTFSSGNRKTFTWSGWIKRGNLGGTQTLITQIDAWNGNSNAGFYIVSDQITAYNFSSSLNSGVNSRLTPSMLFRDTNAWYHIVMRLDTTQSTESDRLRFYINGELQTSFTHSNYPTSNQDCNFNTGVAHGIGSHTNGANYFDGYMAEVCLIDGTALDPTSFGEFDADTGIWKPIDVSGLTFGTNGFYLPFENSAALGQDDSGNGNNFTVNNLTSIDQTTDTPTNNYPTFNPLIKPTTDNLTIENGNLSRTNGTSAAWTQIYTTIGASSGKWYFEAKIDSTSNADGFLFGIADVDSFNNSSGVNIGTVTRNYLYQSNGNKRTSGTDTSFGASLTTGDIVGVAFDLDNNYIYFSKNGTWQNSGDPTSGASGTGSAFSITSGYTYCPAFATYYTSDDFSANFGNPPYTISSGNSDSAGFGNFEYAVPSGYYALNTKNLAEYG